MKKVFNYRRAPLWALLWGVLGFVFQYLLQRTGLDHKGLYITDHPAAVCSFVLIPFAMTTFWLCCRPLKKQRKACESLPQKTPSPILGFAAAALLLFCGFSDLSGATEGLATLRILGAILCGLVIAVLSYLSLTKKKLPFGLYATIALLLIMFVVGNHRHWAAEPQVLVFFFPLMACIFLLLSAYQYAALAAGCGSRRLCCLFSSAGLYFCMTFLPQGGAFYGSMSLWLLAQQIPFMQWEDSREAA